MCFERKRFLPFKKIEGIINRFADKLMQLFGRQILYPAGRMYPDTVQHFVLDNIPYAGKNILVEQRVAYKLRTFFMQLRLRFLICTEQA